MCVKYKLVPRILSFFKMAAVRYRVRTPCSGMKQFLNAI